MSSNPTSVAEKTSIAEHAIRASKLEMSSVNQLNDQYRKFTQEKAQAAEGWHGADDIQTLVGLEGNFLWTEDFFRLSQIQFTFNPGQVGSQGTYKITSLQATIEEGMFFSVPNNPAIGWAFITLVPSLNPMPRSFTVAGMMTDSAWKILIILLNKLGQTGPILPPFSAIRIS